MNKEELVKLLKSKDIRNILSEIWVEHLYLVGSYSRWDNTLNSDIDLVYKKNKNIRIWWIKFIKNKMILENRLNKKVDLVNYDYIYKDIKPFIEKDKILIY